MLPRRYRGNDWAGDLQAASQAGYTFAPEHFAQLDTQFGLDPRENAPEPVAQPDPNAPLTASHQTHTPEGETA
jgi:hypothetical protein